MTAVQPLGRFGAMQIAEDDVVGQFSAPAVQAFHEKPEGDGAWVNGGFFVLEPSVHRSHPGGRHAVRERAAREPGRRR